MALWLVLQLIAAPAATTCRLPADGTGVASALQACIDAAAPGTDVQIAAGTYVVERQVLIRKPLTLRTAGLSGRFPICRTRPEECAAFTAAADFSGQGGMLRIESTAGVRLLHLVLDGNRSARLP